MILASKLSNFQRSLSYFNKLTRYSSTTERVFAFVDNGGYIRHRFQKQVEDVVNVKQQKFDLSFTVIPDVVSVSEEQELIDEIEKALKRLRYQQDHWDNVKC